MRSAWGLLALLVCGCAAGMRSGASPAESHPARTSVAVRSYHDEAMDVYAICGAHDAVLLGRVDAQGEAEFTPARSEMVCATGLRFAMVPAGQKTGGYVTEALGVMPRHIDLLIEKYPALSYWRVR